MKFPQGFMFGLANADHQVEAYDPAYEDVWDLWERTQNRIQRKRACDFQERYEEDIKLAADLGTKIFRFSVSWARVQTGENSWNEEALDHYRAVAQCIKDKGMKVMVTLVHFTWPVWLERDHGGLIGKGFPDRFALYAEKLSERFGDLVDYWISFNEPTQMVHGYIKTWWHEYYYMPPGMPSGTNPSGQAEAVGKFIYNLFSAHARARVAIKGHHPAAKVGVNPLVTGFPPWVQWLLDNQFRSRWLLRAMYKFSYSRPLIIEKAKVDIIIGCGAGERQDTLFYSQPYQAEEGNKKEYISMPAGHGGLLALTNAVIAQKTGQIRVDAHGGYDQPISLADYFASLDGATPNTAQNDEGLKRIKRRGVITVGVKEKVSPIELSLAKGISQQIFGNEEQVEYVKIPDLARPKALSTKVSVLNKLWHFFGAAGLIANANWWYLGSRGKLPKKLCPEEAIGAHDFIGFDYYWGLPTHRLHRFSQLIDAAEGRFLTAPVWPEGLRNALHYFHQRFPGQEIIIVENGSVPLADGIRRRDYLKMHLQEVSQACAEGVPVSAYLLWSLTSNREWGHAFDHNTDFGLYTVELDSDPELKRVPTGEVAFYQQVISAHQADEEAS